MQPIRTLFCTFLLLGLAECGGETRRPDAGPETTDSSEVECETLEISETCPDGLIVWPPGTCAPQVDECENDWELPLVGGGCLPVGPRACPATWDPGADVDCRAGELLPCPEGFVEEGDGAYCVPHFDDCPDTQVPRLGGGCRQVGPSFDDSGGKEPHFDYCDQGELALPGGGCEQVGPRACPKLWDSDADVECEIGDLLPCPEGWEESQDGLHCEPAYDQCGPGELPLPGGGCKLVLIPEDECPEGPYPELPEGTTQVVYVNIESACVEGCGGIDSPFPDISSALSAASDEGWVLVAPGIYQEGILLDKPVHVAGLCAAKVMLTGTVDVASEKNGQAPVAGVAVVDSTGAEISGLTVASPCPGIAVVNAQGVTLRDIDVSAVAGLGIYFTAESEASLERVWVHDVEQGDLLWMGGFGLWVEKGADVSAKRTLIESVREAGLRAISAGTAIEFVDGAIRSTRPNQFDDRGFGIWADLYASVTVKRSVIENNREMGIMLMGDNEASVLESVVRNTEPDAGGGSGHGLASLWGSKLVVRNSLVEGNHDSGIAVVGPGSKALVTQTVVRDTKYNTPGVDGYGILSYNGGEASVSGCVLEGNSTAGFAAFGADSYASMRGCAVRQNHSGNCETAGGGILMADGAVAVVSSCALEGNGQAGAIALQNQAELHVDRSVARDSLPCSDDYGGWGIVGTNGALVTLSDSLVERVLFIGVSSSGDGTEVLLERDVIRDTQPDALLASVGYGILASDKGAVSATDCVVEANQAAGAAIAQPGTNVDLYGCVIRGTLPDPGNGYGYGVIADQGASVTLMDCMVEENIGSGLYLVDPGTEGLVTDSVVRNTQPAWPGGDGEGVSVVYGGSATVAGTVVEGNMTRAIGMSSCGDGDEEGNCVARLVPDLVFEASVARHTQPDAYDGIGYAFDVFEGNCSIVESLLDNNIAIGLSVRGDELYSDVRLTDSVIRNTSKCVPSSLSYCGAGVEGWEDALGIMGVLMSRIEMSRTLLEENEGIGMLMTHGAELLMDGCVVRRNIPDELHKPGIGVSLRNGVQASISGSIFEENFRYGMHVLDPDTNLTMRGSIISDTVVVPGEEGAAGEGLVVAVGAEAVVSWGLFLRNSTLGAGCLTENSRLTLDRCAVLDTMETFTMLEFEDGSYEEQRFGDGLAAVRGEMIVSSTLVANSGRAGVYCQDAAGSISDSIVTGSSSYGLALERSAASFSYEDAGNFIIGNALELPPKQAAEVTVSPEGLPPPPPPPPTFEE